MYGGQREKRPFEEIDLCSEVLICNSEQTVHEYKSSESPLAIESGSIQRRLQKKWLGEEVELLKQQV